MNFKSYVWTICEKLGISQVGLARLMQVNQVTVYRWTSSSAKSLKPTAQNSLMLRFLALAGKHGGKKVGHEATEAANRFDLVGAWAIIMKAASEGK
ncbi:hypothetical protein OAU50_02245 [Planctomycetota bacterium]|nr:hypothetical protein [Planctomycetota bacterium]